MPQPTRRFQLRPRTLVILAVILALAGWFGYRKWAAVQPEPPQLVSVVKADVTDLITAQGKLEAKSYVDVGTRASGQLQKLHVEVGQDVEAGQLLAEIDPTTFQSTVKGTKARLQSLKAQLAQQQAQAALSRQIHQRNLLLQQGDAISTQEVQTSAAELKAAEGGVASLRAQIAESESTLETNLANLGYTKIYSPISGTVVSQTTREGQTVNASQMAPTIVQVANLDLMTVRAQVAEADVPSIHEGMPVYFSTLGSLDKRWNGTVRQVLPAPTTVNDVVLYEVLIDVDNTKRELMTGMTTQVFFVRGEAKNALAIPVTALGAQTTSGTYAVQVMQNGRLHKANVQVGVRSRSLAEVRSGLKETDEVAIVRPGTGAEGAAGGGSGARRRMGMPFM